MAQQKKRIAMNTTIRILITLVLLTELKYFETRTWSAAIDLDNLAWDVQYLIDSSQSDFGQSQLTNPRDNRGLALSPDGQFLYAGYNSSLDGLGEVRRIDLTQSDFIDAADAQTTGVRGKAIAVDDVGRVYLAEGASIEVYSADLSTKLFSLTGLSKAEGVAVTRENGQLVLYVSDRTDGDLRKWELDEIGAGIDNATADASFGQTGSVALSSDLRGVEIDPNGHIWVAGLGNDTLYRITSDGNILDAIPVSNPFDIGFDGNTALVTRESDLVISRFDVDSMLSLGSDLTVPWLTLELDPDGQSDGGALAGIAVIPGQGFFIANEAGQTLNEMSTYGNVDANSQNGFTDFFNDDNEPILFATTTIPTPPAVWAGASLLCGLIAIRRTRKIR